MDFLIEYLPIIMFAVLLGLIVAGFPVAFTLSGTALLFAVIGYSLEVFYWSDLGFIPMRVWGIVQNFTLLAVPLFVFMGIMLEKSGVAEELLDSMSKIMKGLKASLAVAVVLVGGILAATTGIVGATVLTLGVLTLPTMLSRGYDKRLVCGTIAASGTLGQIIPPSIVLVLLGDIMNVDVGDIFVGAMFPGMLLVGLYLLYITLVARIWPTMVPQYEESAKHSWKEIKGLLVTLAPALSLVIIVLGSILFGLASPTEAAACGATGSILITWGKGKLSMKTLREVMRSTAAISAMVFTILVGSQFFGVVFRGLAGDDVIAGIITGLGVDRHWILFFLMALIFLLGFFLDFLEISFIVIPIIYPVLSSLGFDPIWIAILIAVNLQTSFLTPPFGFSLFYLKGVAPDGVTTMDIYKGVAPYVAIQIIGLFLIAAFPEMATWLPKVIFE